MIFEIASLVFSAVGAVCVAGCLCVGLGWFYVTQRHVERAEPVNVRFAGIPQRLAQRSALERRSTQRPKAQLSPRRTGTT